MITLMIARGLGICEILLAIVVASVTIIVGILCRCNNELFFKIRYKRGVEGEGGLTNSNGKNSSTNAQVVQLRHEQ